MNQLSLSEKFHVMRKRRKITKYDLATVSGINRNTIAQLEDGDCLNKTLGTMLAIAQSLQCQLVVELKPYEDFQDAALPASDQPGEVAR